MKKAEETLVTFRVSIVLHHDGTEGKNFKKGGRAFSWLRDQVDFDG